MCVVRKIFAYTVTLWVGNTLLYTIFESCMSEICRIGNRLNHFSYNLEMSGTLSHSCFIDYTRYAQGLICIVGFAAEKEP